MIKLRNSFLLAFALFLAFVASCSNPENKVGKKELEKSSVKLRIVRFEHELKKLEGCSDISQIATFNRHYYGFFDLFNTGIIRIGKSTDAGYNERLQDFLHDKYIHQLNLSTDSVYSNFDRHETELNNGFNYYHHYFPKRIVPSVYTFVSGFNCAIAPTDSILGIGIDYFLGTTKNYYTLLDFPEYQKRKLKPEYLVPTALQHWIRTEFETDSAENTLLAALIDEGKTLYALKQCLPEINDTILFGFSAKQLEWCNSSELSIWSFLVDKKLLFNTNVTEYNRYIAEGPFTPGMPRESPARAVCWVGYKIVDAFMQHNKNMSLEKLMNLNSAQTILNRSKYKPRK